MPISPPTLVILAAGRSSRYGRLKQLDPIGPGGAALLDYAMYDGLEAGFGSVVVVVAKGKEADFGGHLEHARRAGHDIRLAVQDDQGTLVDPRW
ncbi:MAG: NTP transferase domain-containing protein, partial [Gemmatimonadota bacterium]|nr:NTP transferase domain-containing protein [Gemmatimonadota bacterium]